MNSHDDDLLVLMSKAIAKEIVDALDEPQGRARVFALATKLRDAIRQTGDSLIGVSLAEAIECIDPAELRAEESCFRRGYVHGYIAALDHGPGSSKEQDEYLEELSDWRNRRDLDEQMPEFKG